METGNEYLRLLSVGIDVGSSTSLLVFSRITLKRERNLDRFVLVDRELLYDGNIIFTPLLDPNTIDMKTLIQFFKQEYANANIRPEMVDTGAVIVTGETAKKKNAEELVKQLSSKAGKFVSASAGPNYESVLAANGSGIVELSRNRHNTIMNVDIGGGSTKLAIVTHGHIHSTSSINVGGRLLGIDKNFKIWRINEPTEIVMTELRMNYQLGDIISEADVIAIAHKFATALVEVMQRPAASILAKKLMMTDDLDFSIPINAISFSGGVAELMYQRKKALEQGLETEKIDSKIPFDDIGWYLADEILQLICDVKIPIIEPANKIRATVIGAGAFSLSISGSTCYYDRSISLPLNNVLVVSVNTNFREISGGDPVKMRKFKDAVSLALSNYNLVEGIDTFALFFNDIYLRAKLEFFAKALETSLPNSFSQNKLVIIILGVDGAKMLGITIKRETSLKKNLFCLDELLLEDGDWIDIGAPFGERGAFPVIVKSLVFNKNNEEARQ
ncbi:MAG: ethanolamine ammonia-lyase reactivating factor EutA [Candidatus Helarchaeota archaeon]|nr:ethanolamine ammonia-lyase reactivating factor EutA [Candidatus Helarchaeota archaeon]